MGHEKIRQIRMVGDLDTDTIFFFKIMKEFNLIPSFIISLISLGCSGPVEVDWREPRIINF